MVYEFYMKEGAHVSFYTRSRWSRVHTWSMPRTGYGSRALALVCRQIKNEYRPIYHMKVTLAISLPLLPEFLSTHFKTRDDCKSCPRQIVVYMAKAREDNMELPTCKSIDILPLIWMSEERPGFECTFQDCSTAFYNQWRAARTREHCAATELNEILANGLAWAWPDDEERNRIYELRVTRYAAGEGKRDQWLDVEARILDATQPDSNSAVIAKHLATNTKYFQMTTASMP
jgi:hypothetical protein